MTTIKMLHSFKTFAAGAIVTVETNLAEWLISRNYAQPAEKLSESVQLPAASKKSKK